MYGKYEYFVRTAVPGTWYIPGVRVPGRWYSYVVQSIILVVTPVSFSIMSGNIINVFHVFERSEFLIAICEKKKNDRLCGVCVWMHG